jgi:hypothetical protein
VARPVVVADLRSNHQDTRHIAEELVTAAAQAGAGAIRIPWAGGPAARGGFASPGGTDAAPAASIPSWLLDLVQGAHARGLGTILGIGAGRDLRAAFGAGATAVEIPVGIIDDELARAFDGVGSAAVVAVPGSLVGFTRDAEDQAASAVARFGGRGVPMALLARGTSTEPYALSSLRTLGHAHVHDVVLGHADDDPATVLTGVALALGARILVKPLTLCRAMRGPDHATALVPHELREVVRAVAHGARALGLGLGEIGERQRSRPVVRSAA